MGFLSGLGTVAGIGGAALGGYERDQQARVASALQQKQQEREDASSRLQQALGGAQIADLRSQTEARNAKPVAPPLVLGKGAKAVTPEGGFIADNPDDDVPKTVAPGTGVRNAAGGYDVPVPAYHPIDPNGDQAVAGRIKVSQEGYHPPPESFTPVAVVPPEGGPAVVKPFNKTSGVVSESIGGKPLTTGLGGTGALAPVADMVTRLSEIKQHMTALANGEWKVTPAMQAREAAAYGKTLGFAEGHVPVKETAIAAALGFGGAGGKDYPRFQALMNSSRSMGDDAAKVFKGRQNEAAVTREVALNQLTSDDFNNPTVVQQKLQRLQDIVALAQQTQPGGAAPGGRGAGPGAPVQGSEQQRAYDAAASHLKGLGKTPAEITQTLGTRPP